MYIVCKKVNKKTLRSAQLGGRERVQVPVTKEGRRVRPMLLVLCGMLMLFMAAPQLRAQLTVGGVVGTVKDSTGAVIRGAQLTLTNNATQIAQKAASNASGRYVFAAVPIGTYTLNAVVPRFKTYVESHIHVHIQNTVLIDITLVPGLVKQRVAVVSAAPLLQTQNASLGQTFNSTQINDLPLNGRNWLSLAGLASGSYSLGATGSSTIFANGASTGQVDVRLNGTDDNNEVFGGSNVAPVPDSMQEFKIQDGDNNAQFGQFAGAVINAATKSGTNRLNGDLWEYLRNEALDANGYFNDQHDASKPEYRRNQFGGTVGGPVYIPKVYNGRDKTFFFFDFQHTGILQSSSYTESVPTSEMQSSGFTNLQDLITDNTGTGTDTLGRVFPHGTVLDPATTRGIAAGEVDPVSGFTNTTKSTIYVRDPFFTGGSIAGIKNFTALTSELNIMPQDRLDPNAVKLLATFPAQNTPGYQNDYYVNVPAPQHTNQYDVRIDEKLGAKDSIWGDYSWSNQVTSSVQPFPGPIGPDAGSQGSTNPHYVISLHYTHLFSSNMINQMTEGYDHDDANEASPYADILGIPAQYGIQGIPQFDGNGGLPTFGVSGLSSFGGHGFRPTLSADSGLQFQDNLMKIFGNHQLNVGFDFNHIRGNITQPSASKGSFSFTGAFSDVPNKSAGLNGIADMLLAPENSTIAASPGISPINDVGGPASFTGSNYGQSFYYADYYAGYAQDNWTASPRLTVNLVLRYNSSSPYSESLGHEANFVMSDGGNGPSAIYYMPKKGCQIPRNPEFTTLLADNNVTLDCTSGLGVNKGQKDNWAPRLGFAYRLPPETRLVLRGGYGVTYGAFDSVGYGGTLGTNYPFLYTISAAASNSQAPEVLPNGAGVATMETAFGAINLDNPALVSIQNLFFYGKQYHYKTPMIQSMNLALQYQFTGRDSLQIAYVGSLGRHLDTFGTLNAPSVLQPVGAVVQSIVPMPDFARNSQYLQTIAISDYNSMQLTYEHQFQNGLAFMANYTWGKCMSDDNGQAGLGAVYRAEWLPGFGIGKDDALCVGDSAQLLHVMGEYALPFGRGQRFFGHSNGLINAFIGGWQFNYILTGQSGQPITIACATSTNGSFGCHADLVPGQNPYGGPHNQTQWLNPKAFVTPPDFVAGDSQSNFTSLGSAPSQVRGPGFYDLDSSLFKNFAMGKNVSLQFRLEVFNTFNNLQLGNPGQLNYTDLTDFSEITGTRDGPRIGQLALKLFY